MNLLSFFCGCGGLDYGFQLAGFDIVWANDNASSVASTYKANFPNTHFSNADIRTLDIDEIPSNIEGIIGGPPCQSWSYAGKGLGINDPRGRLFHTFIKILRKKRPLFFLAENVKGILSKKNNVAFDDICKKFKSAGYSLNVCCVNAADYGVAQNRERVLFIGFRRDLNIHYQIPPPLFPKKTVREVIGDLANSAVQQGMCPTIPNHEYWTGGFSYIFMSRNRVLNWNGQSFTIQASGRQTSIHPQAPKMKKVKQDVMRFVPGKEHLYRRLTVRECARLQSFPDSFIFNYTSLNNGYKMVGNAVPVELAHQIALSIKAVLPT